MLDLRPGAALVALAGLAQLGLVLVGSRVPRVMRWDEELPRLGPANRRLFWVYGAFIVGANLGFGLLSLLHADALAEGRGLAGGLALFLALYWAARLAVQLLVFRGPGWPAEARRPVVAVGFSILFLALTAVYAAAFAGGFR